MGAGKECGPLDAVYKLSTEEATGHMLRCKKCAAVRRVLCMVQSEKKVESPDRREKIGAGGGLDSAGAGQGASWCRVVKKEP
eukprot:10281095-Ditylum_brightwellii.AAC.1